MMRTVKTRERSTDVVGRFAFIVSLLCSAGLVHVEFRLYSDRQLMNAGDVVLSREERVTIRPLCDKKESEEQANIIHDKMGLNKKAPAAHSRLKRSDVQANTTQHDVIRRAIQQELKGLVTKCVDHQKLCVKGSKGTRGKRGRQGARGKHGPVGPQGNKGDQGDAGHPGPQGPPGPTGDKGAVGPKGQPGESISAPAIEDPPKSQVVNETNPVSFACDVQGNPKPRVTWSKLNSALLVGRHVMDLGGGLLIKDARSRDEGVYTCTGRNVFGTATASANLTVQVGAKISQQLSPVILEEQQNVTFVCNATGQPQPVITWSRAFKSLPGNHRVVGENLTIWNLTREDSGIYVCHATNLLNSVTSTEQLTVLPVLQFTVLPPPLQNVMYLQHVLLHCQARGATVSWQRASGQPLPAGHVIYPNGTLLLKKVKELDEGTYTCTAASKFNRPIQATTTIQVHYGSCSIIKSADPSTSSGNYVIDPDGPGGVASLTVYCDMTDKGGVGVTVISHDAESRTHVDSTNAGCSSAGCYSKDVHYAGASTTQLTSLTEVSANCEQFIKFECHNDIVFVEGSAAWWVSRDGTKMDYWGGATPGSNKCACGMTNSCTGGTGCNCDNYGKGSWYEDSGLLTDKSTLPVTQIRLGDLDQSHEEGYHTLGKFKCYGQ